MFNKVILYSVLLYLPRFTQSQTIPGDTCRPQTSDENDVLMALRKLQLEFTTYRTETQQQMQELNGRLQKVEAELEEIKSNADEPESMLNGTEIYGNSSNGQCFMKIIIDIFSCKLMYVLCQTYVMMPLV